MPPEAPQERREALSIWYVASTKSHLPLSLQSYVAVADEATARALEIYETACSASAFSGWLSIYWQLGDDRISSTLKSAATVTTSASTVT